MNNVKGFIVYPTYRVIDGKAQILLFGRLENGESFVTINDYKPYFWIKESDSKKAEQLLSKEKINGIVLENSDFANFDKEHVTKVILQIPKDVPNLRKLFNDNGIICYEADIRFSYRFLIDLDIKACMQIKGTSKKSDEFLVQNVFENPEISPTEFWPTLNVVSIDIETDMENRKIYAISLYSDKIKKVLILKKGKYDNAESFSEERDMLIAFQNHIIDLDPDVITGWNLIDFDFSVIRESFKKNSVPFVLGRTTQECTLRLSDSFFTDSSANFPGRAVIDAMHLLKVSFVRVDDYKLNTVAKTILGEGKLITHEDVRTKVEELYEKDPQKLVDYNLKDSELVYRILEKSQILDLSIKRSILTRMQIDRVNASIASFDSLYLKELQKRKTVAPSAIINESEERILGGFVMQSKPGIYEGIVVLDFKSLYPSIIRTFNIDPYSFVPYEKYLKLSDEEKKALIEAPNRAHFRNQEGILPIIIKHLWEQRDLAKKRKDDLGNQAIKILMNSFFGILANPTCRFYSLEMANAITHFGQFLNKLTAQKIADEGYEVIYADTDSTFVNIKTTDMKVAEKIGIELQNFINEFLNKYIHDTYNRISFLELEFDKAFKKFLMPKVRGQDVGAKKRYAGIVEENGKEQIVVTGLEAVRRDWTDVSKKFQTELLEHIFHDKPIDSYIKKFVDDLKNGKMDNLLVYKKAIRKGVSEYTKTTPPHIKAARKLGRELPGIIEYVMTLDGPEPIEKRTSKIDYDHYIDKQIKPIADSIISFQDKNFDDLISKHKQTGLGSWMG